MKILMLDLETSPNSAYVWGLYNQNIHISQMIDSSRVMCFSAKWYGEDDVFFCGENDTKHRSVIKELWKLLNEADVVVHYNGSRFDIPTANKEFAKYGMLPPSTYQQIDLLRTTRKQFRFPSNKLDYVAQALGLGSKTEHEGFGLWVKCMEGDKDAWAKMEEYNIQDVLLLEKLYVRLLPWIKGHPTVTDKSMCCPSCGSHKVTRRGYHRTKLMSYARFQCKECGSWGQSKRPETTTPGMLKSVAS